MCEHLIVHVYPQTACPSSRRGTTIYYSFWLVPCHLLPHTWSYTVSRIDKIVDQNRRPNDLNVHQQTLALDELSPQSLYAKCTALAQNLWWSWHPEVTNLFRDLDPIRWRQLDHNPIALLAEFTPERLESRAAELVLYSRINQAHRRLKEYLLADSTWSNVHAGVLGSKPVVYFSAEFGIHESVPIYSGGLGVLAGDHVKSASGLGIPLVAVGLFYNQGYFRQQLDGDGYQHEEYLDSRVELLPIESATDNNGNPITVTVETRSGPIHAKVWGMAVGRASFFFWIVISKEMIQKIVS